MDASPDTEPSPIDLADKAIELMRAHDVPPRPSNYALWYRYSSGEYKDLTDAIDHLVERGQPFTDEICADLYQRFLGVSLGEEFISDAAEKISGELENLITHLDTAGVDAAAYGSTLEGFKGALEGSDGVTGLKQSLMRVWKATKDVDKQNKKLEQRLRASAVEIVSLRDTMTELQKESLTDALTGITNRKGFDQQLAKAMDVAGTSSNRFSVALLDIDHFKRFNDTHGHQIGDQVLKLVGQILMKAVKGRDTAARYGGEEFAIIFDGASLNDAKKVAEQIRVQISEKKLINRTSGEDLGKITVSFGIAHFVLGEDRDTLIERADKALYMSKEKGRNQVCTESNL